jgi:hypothetical protein
MGAESAEQPPEQMSERHDHVKNLTETSGIQLCAKSFILQVYDVLARHRAVSESGASARHIREVEAESVALICCETLGLEGADSCRGYVTMRLM